MEAKEMAVDEHLNGKASDENEFRSLDLQLTFLHRQTTAASTKDALEQRYMRALEARIAQLEAMLQLSSPMTRTSMPNSSGSQQRLHDSLTHPFLPFPGETNSRRPSIAGTAHVGTLISGMRDQEDQPISLVGIHEENTDRPKSRVQYIVGQYSAFNLDFEEVPSSKTQGSGAAAASVTKNRTIFRKVLTETQPRKILREEIEIDCLELRELFTAISCTRVWPAAEHGPLQLKSPFADFVWFWDEFKAACKPLESDSHELNFAREDLSQVLDFLEHSQLEPYFKLRESSLASGTLPYEYLWTLFPPGTKVYTRALLGEWQMLEVRSCDYPSYSNISSMSSPYSGTGTLLRNQPEWVEPIMNVECNAFDWDGSSFNVFQYNLHILRDLKKTAITIDALDVFPARFYRNTDGVRNDDALRRDLVRRGERYTAICMAEKTDREQYDYQGKILADVPPEEALSMMQSPYSQGKGTSSMYPGMGAIYPGMEDMNPFSLKQTNYVNETEYRGLVLPDTAGYLQGQRGPHYLPLGYRHGWMYVDTLCQCETCKKSPLLQWLRVKGHADKGLDAVVPLTTPERLILCPPRILGYALKSKSWAQVPITSLRKVNSEKNATFFDEHLQLDDQPKRMLKAFVENHEYSDRTDAHRNSAAGERQKSFDVVEGKGQGLAVLLHGPPGVGKTLTAETIAQATGRPLLSVSVAQIGTNAAHAERRLNTIFVNAARWRAVLLIDEADVFLEERVRTDNPNRNALVSVLLRCVEYYEGIVFLTTNRIKSIDIAVQSRMHLAIQYKNLTSEQMLKIYQNLLADIPDEKIKGKRHNLETTIKNNLCGRRSQMNGRQIRNIVSTARAWAASQEELLSIDHLREVFDSTSEFLEGLKEVNERAKRRNLADED